MANLHVIPGSGGSGKSSGGGGAGSGGLPPEHIQAYIDARMNHVHTELRLELHKEMEPIRTQLAKVPGWGGVWAVIGAIVTSITIVLAVLAWGADRFNGGMSATGAFAQQAVEESQRDAKLNGKLDCLLSKQQNPSFRCK